MRIYYFLGTILISTLAWGADVYHYELREYPKGESCDVLAADLAKRFSAASGTEIYWAGATKESQATCDFKISYIADREIHVTSNVDRSGLGASRKGTKRSLADCSADLPREIAVFKNSTGFDPFISYCYQESAFLNDLPFVPAVEGLGKPNLGFFASDSIVGVTPNVGWTKMLSDIWKVSVEQSLPVASLVARPYISAADKEVTIRYYGKERLYLRADGIAEHKDPAICDEQVQEVRAALAKAARPPIGVYCGKYFHGQYRLGIVTLSTNILGIADLKLTEDPKQFVTLEACRADLPSTLDFYRAKLGKKMLTGICANGTGRFRITAIEEKKAPDYP